MYKGEVRKMKVFICGPLRAGTRVETENNIKRALHIQLVLTELGYHTFCPHAEYGRMLFLPDKDRLNEVAMKACESFLLSCDVLYAMEGYQKSKGSTAEICLAGREKIEVVHSIEQLERFRLAHPELHVDIDDFLDSCTREARDPKRCTRCTEIIYTDHDLCGQCFDWKKAYRDTSLIPCIFCQKGVEHDWVCEDCKDKVPEGFEVLDGQKRKAKAHEWVLGLGRVPKAFYVRDDFTHEVAIILKKKEPQA